MKRLFLILVILSSAAQAFAGEYRVVVVKSDDALPFHEVIAGFKSEFPVQGLDLIFMDGGLSSARLAEKISSLQPALILCIGSRALESVSEIRTVPKIFCLVTYSNALAFADRADIAGVLIDIPPAVQFRMLKQAFPGLKRIGVIYDPHYNQDLMGQAEKSSRSLNLHLVSGPVRTIRDIPSALHRLEGKIDLLWSVYDQTVYSPETAKYILLFSLRKGVPFIGFSPQFAKAGALLALYGNYRDMGRQAGQLGREVHDAGSWRIRRVEPRQVRVAVNEKVARAMGITFPDHFLRLIDKTY